ncbi:MAG: DMT family transporter [Firmicutes bacterium]|nr:DMT family transporter [Bacillota bacterium]
MDKHKGLGEVNMDKRELKSSALLLITAAIWGFAFVAQRMGTMHVGAFTFTAFRFALGSLSLAPLLIYFNRKKEKSENSKMELKTSLVAGAAAGSVLFIAASLQQIGLIYTDAGKAGFITGLYIVIVPIFGIFLKQRIHISTWAGIAVAVLGLYFLSVTEGFYISKGDLYVIIGAFFWAIHILIIDHFTKRVDSLKLSFLQFVTCFVFSMITALIFETIDFKSLSIVLIPLLYGGIMSAGIAYTLQIIGQKHARPSHAAVAMSMESVFASIGGFLILNEVLGIRGYIGCALMLAGMLLSQYENLTKKTGSSTPV